MIAFEWLIEIEGSSHWPAVLQSEIWELHWYESSNDTEIDTSFFVTSAESEQEEGFCVEGQPQADGGAQNHSKRWKHNRRPSMQKH